MRIAEQISRSRKRAKKAPRRKSAEAKYALAARDWSTFVERLDNPPAPNVKLKAMLAREPVWERE